MFEPGQVLSDRFRVTRLLGEGGMGVVAAADHLLLGGTVALKALLPAMADNPEIVARFQREARAASRIHSEHVARVLDVALLPNGLPYMVMEFLQGHDLSKELEKHRWLPIQEGVDWVLEAAIGVAAAHARGIVHRDLKPSNLFLAEQPNGRRLVKVLDFGIAKDLSAQEGASLTRTESVFGSVPYMSPEQIRTPRSVDVRADVWAFGIILYELLTGAWPFQGETSMAMASSITMDAPVSMTARRADVPAGLASVVERCLEKNRELRMASVAELGRALAPFGTARAPGLATRIAEVLGEAAMPVVAGSTADPGFGAVRDAPTETALWSSRPIGDAPGRGRRRALFYVALAVAVAGSAWAVLGRHAGAPAFDAAPSVATLAPVASESPTTGDSKPEAKAAAPTAMAGPPPSASVAPSVEPAPTVRESLLHEEAPATGSELRDDRRRRAAPGVRPAAPRAPAEAVPEQPARAGSALIKDL